MRAPIIAGKGVSRPGAEWPIRRQCGAKQWLLVATVQGRVELCSREQVLALGPGDIMLWPPQSAQIYHRHPDADLWEQRWVVFPDRHRWPDWVDPWPIRLGDAWIARSRSDNDRLRVERIMDDVVDACRRDDDPDRRLATAVLAELFCRIQLDGAGHGSSDPAVRTACQAIAANPGEDWSVADMATLVGLSGSRFAHRFTQALGVSPIAWRDRQRMRQAADLLTAGVLPVAEVAAVVGYRDPLYFSRAFKRSLGMSPRAWQRHQASGRNAPPG